MLQIPNSGPEKACYTKRRYREPELPTKLAKKWQKLNPPGGGKFFHAYFCEYCGGWHIGRTSKTYPSSSERSS